LKRSRRVALKTIVASLIFLGGCGSNNIPPFNATPIITGLFPSNITAGSEGFTLQVSGTGFQSNSKGVTFVNWNGSPRSTTYDITSGQLTVQIFASDITTANIISVTATNPAPGGGTSPVNLRSTFTIVQQMPGLTIAPPLGPASVKAGSGDFTLTVNGTGFAVNDIITWNGTPRITTIAPMTPTVATAQILREDVVNVGFASVAVAAPDLVTATPSVSFPITGVDNPMPRLSSLSPSSAAHGGGDFQMRINGSGFAPTSTVLWNGDFRATAYMSASQLVALIPAADIFAAGSATVSVVNPAPGGGTSSTTMFTIQ
jgi:trimeric autotransporter adhesin